MLQSTKTLRSFLLLASAGAVFAPTLSPLHAQEALRTDTEGNPTTPLKLSGSNITGTLNPGRLGTGTPTSSTVLTGTGWAGATPGGNTVAATGNLLMGDSAGNALGVASGADLFRVLQARADSQKASLPAPANLLPAFTTLNLNGGTLNTDGTLTIAANSYLEFKGSPDTAQVPHYAYVVCTSDTPYAGISVGGYYGDNKFAEQANTRSNPLPGVSKVVFTNSIGAGGYTLCITNTTSAPLTIYYPLLALTDPGHPIFASGLDTVAVAVQPVADLDFTRLGTSDRSGRYLAEKSTTLAADSVAGSNANAGTLYAPKLTLQQTVANGAQFGLYRGSLFRDSLPLSTLGTTHGISIQDLAFGQARALPVVSALVPVNNGGVVDNGDGTFSLTWTPAQTLPATDGYGGPGAYVVEINTATEAVSPVASRRRMIDVTSSDAVVSTPGSAYPQPFGPSQWLAQIHPSDGLAPGSGTYRYEVVSRVQPANWGAPNGGDGAMSGLELVGSSSGYGELGGPNGFVGDRLAFLHCTAHCAVIGGGSLQRSVFYESGDAIAIQLAWYAGTGTGLRWDLNRCLFYANVGDRPANCVIAHTGGPTNFERGDISDTAFIGARWSDGSLRGQAMDYVNVATGVIERVCVQGIADAFSLTMPVAVEVRNCVFRQVAHATVGSGSFHDNVIAAESACHGTDSYPTAIVFRNPGVVATNNLLWARGVASSTPNSDQAQAFYFVSSATVTHNIVLLTPATAANVCKYGDQPAGSTSVLDYNLVISTGAFSASGQGFTTGATSWNAYVAANPSLDQHSLYLDLSADPRGLQAVFVDPLNGDFRWAQTDVARRCAAYCRANHVGPATVTSHWPVVPTVDEAVRLLTDL